LHGHARGPIARHNYYTPCDVAAQRRHPANAAPRRAAALQFVPTQQSEGSARTDSLALVAYPNV